MNTMVYGENKNPCGFSIPTQKHVKFEAFILVFYQFLLLESDLLVGTYSYEQLLFSQKSKLYSSTIILIFPFPDNLFFMD